MLERGQPSDTRHPAGSNSNSATTFTAFDPLGRVTASSQQTNTLTYGFTYTYNLAGALTSETYPSGRVVTAGYDAANRSTTLSGNLNGQGTNYITQTVYWPHGAVRQMGYGNNVWHDLGTVSARLQPTGYWDTIGENPNAFLRLEYPNWVNGSGKNNGTLQSTQIFAGAPAPWQSLPNVTQNFGYDNLNRLTSASEGANWSQAYNYDQYGNMWMPASTLGAPPLGPGAPTANVYTNNRNTNSTYDAAGNLTVFGSVSVAYDAENRQKTAGSNSYLYDGLGQRVGKTTTSGTTAYVYDAFGQLAAEYGSASSNLCTTCYLSYDHLGSTRMVTDQNANVVARHDYAPYGQEMTAGVGGRSSLYGASDNVRQKFTGYERDSETALDFAQARYMSSGLGRFTSPDPGNAGADFTNPQSWNAYAYVLGNPVAMVDPSGLDPIKVPCPDCTTTVDGGSTDPINPTDFPWWYWLTGYDPNSPLFTASVTEKAPVATESASLNLQINAPKSGNCIAPSIVQQKLLPIQARAAKYSRKTLLAGLGASGGAGLGKGIGVYASASVQIAVSPNGNAAYAITFAAPAAVTGRGTYAWVTPSTKGLGVLGGSQFGVSNVSDPSELAGVSYDGSASMAAGLGVGADLSVGDGSWQFNVTLGFGIGGRGSVGARTYTAVVPICGSW